MVVVLARVRVDADELADALDERRELVGRRVVGDADGLLDPPVLARAEVVHRRADERRVGEGDERVVERPDPRRPEAHLLDRAFDVVHLDPVADLERAIGEDRDGAEEVLDGVLARQRDRDAADAEAGEQRRDVHAEVVRDPDDAQHDDEDLQGLSDHRDEQVVETAVRALRHARQDLGDPVDDA